MPERLRNYFLVQFLSCPPRHAFLVQENWSQNSHGSTLLNLQNRNHFQYSEIGIEDGTHHKQAYLQWQMKKLGIHNRIHKV
jgi:hypothetical protein